MLIITIQYSEIEYIIQVGNTWVPYGTASHHACWKKEKPIIHSFIHSFIHWKAVHSVGDHRSIDPFFSLFPHKKMNKYNGRQWQKCPLPRSLAIHI